MMGARLPAVALGLSLATGMHPCKVPLHAPCPLYLVIGPLSCSPVMYPSFASLRSLLSQSGHPHRTPSLGFRGQVILLPVTQGSPPRTCIRTLLRTRAPRGFALRRPRRANLRFSRPDPHRPVPLLQHCRHQV
ncbi:hypothetical protein BC826DRAFT_1060184 [Russula brevipes]|nr:hypothetical protein BC826DRAFT_1060184 [Russula brevipes]